VYFVAELSASVRGEQAQLLVVVVLGVQLVVGKASAARKEAQQSQVSRLGHAAAKCIVQGSG
jgi:hypothetical protein